MIQLITPTPDIPCKPGWCLQYVRQTFGAPAVEPTATAGWANAKYRHEDWDFPAGCWVPVWFSLATEPAGHVALMAPDGSVYSTSDDSTTPHHHPNMQDLLRYYWRNPLTYLGWSEDISGIRVVQEISLQAQSESIKPITEEIDVAAEQNIMARLDQIVSWIDEKTDRDRNMLAGFVRDVVNAKETITPEQIDAKFQALTAATKPEGQPLFKGDASPEVYAWDGAAGFRHIEQPEYITLISSGAVLKELPQAIIDGAVGGKK